MDGARWLDGLITTEFSFIQELIWTSPHKNPFPLCSHSILSRLKKLRGEWLRASPTTRQSAMFLIKDLDADIKNLVELRKRCLKLLACKDSTADASKNTVYLAKEVDSILVQHLENSWKEPSFNLTDMDIQKQTSIDQDVLAADVLQLFVLDSSHQCEHRNKDGIVEANSNVLEADCQEDIATELSGGKHFSPLPGQSSSSSSERSTAVSTQEPGLRILTTETIEDDARQSASEATNNTLQEVMCAPNADDNSFKMSGVEEEQCVFTPKPNLTKSSECDTPKATLSTSIQAQSALASDEGPDFSIITPEAVIAAGRGGTIGTSECSPLTDEDSTATSEAKPNQFFKETEDMEDDVEQVVTQLQESSSCFTTDEYFSASSDDEHDSMIEARGTKDSEIPKSAIIANEAASLTRENASELSEVQQFPPGAGHVCPLEIQIFSSNRGTDGAQKFDEHDLRESPFGGTAGIKDEIKSEFAGNCSKEELVEVEMTLRAKICVPESEEPHWHVMFALLNYSNFKISVQKLEYWSLDKQEDVKCIYWPPGEMILREQPSFLCHSIKVPCAASNTSPRLAFSWQYSKLPEWILTKDGKPKIEKGTIRKRLGNMLSFGGAKKTLRHDTGPLSLKPTKKRTA